MAKPIRLSIRTHVVVLLLVLLGLLALIPAIVAVRSTQELVDAAAITSFDGAGTLTIRELHRLEETARAGAEALAANPLADTVTHGERAADLNVLTTVLRAAPGISAAYIGWPDGDFVLMRPVGRNAERLGAPAGAKWLAQWTDATGTRFDFLDMSLSAIESRQRIDFAFDPRQRPWFSEAGAVNQTIVTAPYIFFTTREPGISAARMTASGAVAGVDVSLWDLSNRLPQGMPTRSSEAAILDADGGLLAYTDVERLWALIGNGLAPQGSATLPMANELGSPVVAAMAEALAANPGGFSGHLRAGGREWLAATQALDDRGTMLLIAAPTDELGSEAQAIRLELLLLFASMALLALPFIWLASRYLADPIERFAHDMEQAARLDFTQRPNTKTRIRELLALDRAIGAMGQSLRGFSAIFGSIAQEDETSKTLAGVLDALIATADADAACAWIVNRADGSLQPAVVRGRWANAPLLTDTALARLAETIADRDDVIEIATSATDTELAPLLAGGGSIRIVGIPLRSDSDRLAGVIAIAVDAGDATVTQSDLLSLCRFVRRPLAMAIDRQHLMEELASARSETELILNSVADGIHVLDTDGRIHRTNPSAAAMLGWSPGELEGRQGHPLIHHHKTDGSMYPVEDCPIHNSMRNGELRRATSELFFRKDGSPFAVDFESTPMRDESGAIVGTVVSFRDVSERDRWQRELRERIKELRCLYRVVQLTSEVNRANEDICQEIVAVLPQSVMHEDLAVARIVLDGREYRSANWQPPSASLRSDIGEAEGDFIELGYRDSSGTAGESPFLSEEREMLDAVAAHIFYMNQSRQLNARLVQLERLNAVGQLTGGVAHDFNNLLTVVLGNAEALSERLQGNAELYPMTEAITMAACRGADLTRQLLAFARQQPLSTASTDIGRLLEGMQPLLHRTLPEQIAVRFCVPPDSGEAIIDGTQLENAILNLCLNARDAMPDGGSLIVETWPATVDETIESFPDEIAPGDYVCIAVSDTGTGMEPATRARVFEPFFTTKEIGKGSGLGLSMVYGFVKQSNGSISVYSEPGHGTTIKLYLPRAAEGSRQPAVSAAEEPLLNGSGTVLVVEDDEMVRNNIASQLRALGYRTVLAETGPEALALVSDGLAFDLLMTDLILPGGMTGQDLARRIREQHPKLPVVLTSGYAERVMQTQDSALGGMHLLSKPYRRRELAELLRRALGEAGA